VHLTQYRAGDKIEKIEVGWACSTYGGKGEVCTGFWWGNLRERDRWGDPGVDGRIILGWIFRKWGCGCEERIVLAHDGDRWRALVSALRNIRVP
jgi:hypothetical protein